MTLTQVRPDQAPPASAVAPRRLVPRRHPRASSPLIRDGIGMATWLSLLVVVGLWVAGGGVQDLTGWGSGLTSIGRLTGLLSSDLLLIQVLLMARIPVVEQAYGQDELAGRHRLVGFTSFNLMVAHLVLISAGYAATAGINPFVQFWEMVVDYPGMLLATAGTGFLILVTVTSIRKARKRLRYESWHLLHLYAYLGVGLAIPHQLWTGQEFLASPVTAIYWWTLWIAAAGAVLVWRLGLPLYRTLRHDLRVSAVVRESPDIISVWMRGRDLDRLPVASGQFFTWRFLTGPGWTRGHPYSLSAAPTGDTLRITVKDLGDGSRALAEVPVGTRVAIEGPYGRLHAGARSRPKVTLMGSGIGITPLRAILEDLPQRPGDVTVIYRASTEHDLVLTRELEQLATQRGARLFHVVGPRVAGRDSWLPQQAVHLSDADALRQLVPDIADQDVYLCGADGWMASARTAALSCGVPSSRIHLERFTW
ncbi:MAG: ferredoxin reductase family protein [Propionicimonas sp.]